jgi:hypothetical protein
MMSQEEYPIRIKNIGEFKLKLTLIEGTGSPTELTIPTGERKNGTYTPNNGYVLFEGKPLKNNGRKELHLKTPMDSEKDGCQLITEKNNGKFLLKIYLPTKPIVDDTNVEVGVDEPPDLPPMDQKQKPKGK